MKIFEKLKDKSNKRMILRYIVALVGAAVFIIAEPFLMPLVSQAVGHATLFTTAITAPAATLHALQDRFAGDTVEEPPEDIEFPYPSSTNPQSQESSSSQSTAPPSSSSMPLPNTSISEPSQPLPPPPEIPKKFQAPLYSEIMHGEPSNQAFLQYGNVWIRNYTKLDNTEIEKVLETPSSLALKNNDQPQVLIYHTHATESYELYDREIYDTRNTWRETDNTMNMVAVGDVLTRELERMGINVIHDTTQHDYPSYNGSYDRSAETMSKYLKQYPSIKVTIDLHRDGIVRNDESIVKTAVEINGKKAAQLMMIVPCDDGSVGVKNWRENLRFSTEMSAYIEDVVPGLLRPMFFCYRNYNLGMTNASVLFEVGTNGNTLEEAKYTAKLVAGPIAKYLNQTITNTGS